MPRSAEPGWPTGLALLAWRLAQIVEAPFAQDYSTSIDRGMQTILSWAGEALEPNQFVEHDCSLVGWSWVNGTHSWVEPTAIQVIAHDVGAPSGTNIAIGRRAADP